MNNPWKPTLKKDLPDPHPTNYYVPNFGLDTNIKASLANLKNMEKKYGTWNLPKEEDVQIESEVEREPLLGWTSKAPKSHPMDYYVPDFGLDHEILSTLGNAKLEEKLLNNPWKPTLKKDLPDPHPTNYYVPNFGLDTDMKASLSNLKNMEKKYGQWNLPKEEDIQLDSQVEREPLLSWSPKKPKSHPVDYFVPNFGLDSDIVSTNQHIADQEKLHPL